MLVLCVNIVSFNFHNSIFYTNVQFKNIFLSIKWTKMQNLK